MMPYVAGDQQLPANDLTQHPQGEAHAIAVPCAFHLGKTRAPDLLGQPDEALVDAPLSLWRAELVGNVDGNRSAHVDRTGLRLPGSRGGPRLSGMGLLRLFTTPGSKSGKTSRPLGGDRRR